MSYTTWHNYGYGICVDDIKTRDVTRLESMLKLAPNLDREIHRWLEECSISEPVWDDYMEFDQDFMLGLATILQKVIEEAEDMLCIIVKDNGLGFPEGILDKLNRDEDIEEDGRHIGIMNVKNRLEVLYQGTAVVSIQNENKGSRVAVSIPRIRKEENTQIEYITC